MRSPIFHFKKVYFKSSKWSDSGIELMKNLWMAPYVKRIHYARSNSIIMRIGRSKNLWWRFQHNTRKNITKIEEEKIQTHKNFKQAKRPKKTLGKTLSWIYMLGENSSFLIFFLALTMLKNKMGALYKVQTTGGVQKSSILKKQRI